MNGRPRRRGLIIDHVEDAVRLFREGGLDRLRDVGDMNPVRHVSGLGDAMRTASKEPRERVLSRPVDAAEAQDRNRDRALAPERLPGLLRVDARRPARVRRDRRRRS